MSEDRCNAAPGVLDWPELPLDAWQDTYDTLHMWTQIVGKVRMVLMPPINHWWHSALYVTARGLSTAAIPAGNRTLDIEFDFIGHRLVIRASDGTERTIALAPCAVADFYHPFMAALASIGVHVKINRMPQEFPDPIRFDEDRRHASYDPEYANRCWRILASTEHVLQEFRSRFIGKCSPVHFFWGSFDLCCTRFSGQRAPERPDADPVTREAYSHEVSSAGFWPGSGDIKGPAFYAYMAPAPEGYGQQRVKPAAAFYHAGLGEFLLMYDDVRASPSPRAALMEFFQTTYEAGATLAKWDREALERR